MPALNIYSTYYMLGAVEEIPLEHTFFRDRYFPTNKELDVFGTARVLADYKERGQKIAPFVLPRVGAIPGVREGFNTFELEPCNISVSMPLTLDQLEARGFGESLLSNKTPEQRANALLIADLKELSSRISRAEELLAVKTILDNGATMAHQTSDPTIYQNITAKFYDGVSNPALYTPNSMWTHSTKSGETWTPGSWYQDMCNMVSQLTTKGRPAKEFVISPDVADFLLNDGWFLYMLDNRRIEMGQVKPEELTESVYQLCTFNFHGRNLAILVDEETYEDNAGNDTAFLPAKTVIVTAPDVGRGLYGAVSQVEKDEKFHTYAGMRVPQHIATQQPPALETHLTARPLFVPKRANPWCVAKNVLA